MGVRMHNVSKDFTGVHEDYDADGKLSSYAEYRNGKYHGLVRRYNADGMRWLCCYYKDDIRHGQMIWKWNHGAVHTNNFYRNGADITMLVKQEFDIENLTDEDKFAIYMKWGIKCIQSD